MKDFKNNIDKMVSKILSEEIEKKSKQVFEQIDKFRKPGTLISSTDSERGTRTRVIN